MKLLLLFCFLSLAPFLCQAGEENPTQALIQEQLWELSHILIWTIVGGLLVTLLTLCAIAFACCNYFCIARRREPASSYSFAHDENLSPVLKKRRNVSLSIVLVSMLLVIALAVVLAFNALLVSYTGPVTLSPQIAADYLGSKLSFQDTCWGMHNFTEAQDTQTQCYKVDEALQNFDQQVQETSWEFQDNISQLVLTINLLAGVLLVLILLAAVGACKQASLPLRMFSVFSLFFAAAFCLFWIVYGLPSSLLLHSCQSVHSSFNHDNSDSFPGIQILAFIYNETDHFQDFRDFERELRHNSIDLNDVNFTALLPQQEELFGMIRSCLWDGVTLDSTLEVTQLKTPMTSMLSLSKQIVNRINKNLKDTTLALPSSMDQNLQQISWGTHDVDEASQALILNLVIEVQYFTRDLKDNSSQLTPSVYHNVSEDSRLLISQLNGLSAFIDISDCQRLKEVYQSLNYDFCRSFLNVSNIIAWLLLLLTCLVVLSFFVAFFAGHRVFSRQLPPRTPEAPNNSINNGKDASAQTSDAAAPLLSSADKYYYGPAPVSYNPAPPPYTGGYSGYEKL